MMKLLRILAAVLRWTLTRFSNGIESVWTICDYADLAMAEVHAGYDAPYWVRYQQLAVPSQDSRAGAFALAQLIYRVRRPARTLFLLNVAPRHDDKSRRKTNGGEYFVFAVLKNGARIVVTQGPALSWLKAEIVSAWIIPVGHLKTQFRSRTVLSTAVNAIVAGRTDFYGERLDLSQIEDSPIDLIELQAAAANATGLDGFVEYRDDFGQLKTTFKKEVIDRFFGHGETVTIEVSCGSKQTTIEAPYVNGIFDVEAGDAKLVFAPGSSSHQWIEPTGQETKSHAFLELAVRNGSAHNEVCTLLGVSAADLRTYPIRLRILRQVPAAKQTTGVAELSEASA